VKRPMFTMVASLPWVHQTGIGRKWGKGGLLIIMHWLRASEINFLFLFLIHLSTIERRFYFLITMIPKSLHLLGLFLLSVLRGRMRKMQTASHKSFLPFHMFHTSDFFPL